MGVVHRLKDRVIDTALSCSNEANNAIKSKTVITIITSANHFLVYYFLIEMCLSSLARSKVVLLIPVNWSEARWTYVQTQNVGYFMILA